MIATTLQLTGLILTKQDDGSKRATSQCLRKKEQKINHWNNKMEKKMTTFATSELGKYPCKEESNRVVGKPTMKRISLQWAYGKLLKIEAKFGHYRNKQYN